jgi:hypothetical protein
MLKSIKLTWQSGSLGKVALLLWVTVLGTCCVTVPPLFQTVKPISQFMTTSQGKTLHWLPHILPLGCIRHPSITDQDAEKYHLVATWWNEKIGLKLFQEQCMYWPPTREFPNGPVVGFVILSIQPFEPPSCVCNGLTMHMTNLPQAAGMTALYTINGQDEIIYGATVQIAPRSKNNLNTWLHEFGHVLGLEHDKKNPKSVMYPIANSDQELDISDEDRKIIRSVYGIDERNE